MEFKLRKCDDDSDDVDDNDICFHSGWCVLQCSLKHCNKLQILQNIPIVKLEVIILDSGRKWLITFLMKAPFLHIRSICRRSSQLLASLEVFDQSLVLFWHAFFPPNFPRYFYRPVDRDLSPFEALLPPGLNIQLHANYTDWISSEVQSCNVKCILHYETFIALIYLSNNRETK